MPSYPTPPPGASALPPLAPDASTEDRRQWFAEAYPTLRASLRSVAIKARGGKDNADWRAEAIQEALCHAWKMIASAKEPQKYTLCSLTTYAWKRVMSGRTLCRDSCPDDRTLRKSIDDDRSARRSHPDILGTIPGSHVRGEDDPAVIVQYDLDLRGILRQFARTARRIAVRLLRGDKPYHCQRYPGDKLPYQVRDALRLAVRAYLAE